MADRPGFLRRLTSAFFAKADLPTLSDVPPPPAGFAEPGTWFGPGEPQAPIAPETAGRQFDFPVAYNLGMARREQSTGGVTFEQLRGFADGYDLLRVVIETRKNQLAGLEWRIGRRDGKGSADDARATLITDFLRFPDRLNDWDTWVRALLEEMLVIDAATVHLRRNRAGGLYALELIDGATIRPLIDSQGRSPMPPLPAYQQILKGIKTADYSRAEIIYQPRNVRVWKVYGYSPVEQIIMTVQIALRRQLHQLQFYTEGTAPDSLFTVPEGWTPDQIAQFQTWFTALMAGNTATRRNGVFLPHGVEPVNLKEGALKDEFDEWLARIVCYAFDVSQQWAVKAMNRATSETAERQSQREGLEPAKKWIKNLIDRVIVQQFGRPDLEFMWAEDIELSAADQAKVDDMLVARGQRTINEARAGRGEPPIEGGDEPLIFTAAGAVRLRDVVNPPPPVTPTEPEAVAKTKEAEGKSRTPVFDRVEKAVKGYATGDHAGPRDGKFQPRAKDVERLTKIWGGFLEHAGRQCSDACSHDPVAKADDGDSADDPEADRDLQQRLEDAITRLDWQAVSADTTAVLQDAAADAAGEAMDDVASEAATGISISFDMVDEPAALWAEQHSANLVTMIADTTRTQIADLVAAQMRGEVKSTELADLVRQAGAFSAKRAELIALTESTNAANQGLLLGWRRMRDLFGVVTKKVWHLGLERAHCAVCAANELMGPIDLDDEFPSGDQAPSAHPHCFCWMDSVLVDDDIIAKANPYHDGQGRFTTAGGAGGGGQRPSRHFAEERNATARFVDENIGKASAATAGTRILSFGPFGRSSYARRFGLNLDGCEAGITGDKVRHILNNHGDKSELLRGQVPTTRADVGHIAEIFAKGRMSPGNTANTIAFDHEIGQFRYRLIGRLAPTRKAFLAVTLWKTKI